MKAHLMHPQRDFDPAQPLPPQHAELVQDLELETLFAAMADGDPTLLEVASRAVLCSLASPQEIRYRQAVLQDCLQHDAVARELYQTALAAIEGERKAYWGVVSKYPQAILARGLAVMKVFVERLAHLRSIADRHAAQFHSEGFRRFFGMLQAELSDEYFKQVKSQLKELELKHGVLISARLGSGNRGAAYVLRKPSAHRPGLVAQLLGGGPSEIGFTIDKEDTAGASEIAGLKERGINLAANALAQSCDHILSFFRMVQVEMAFYIGCMNLKAQLAALGEPVTFAQPLPIERRSLVCQGLYDVCLALKTRRLVVGNDLHAEPLNLAVITGANQGGKSTFLRSVGQAQLMMQCGMFTAAEAFSANVCDAVFTHFKREEDAKMNSGRLDEELGRMNAIAGRLTADSLVLFNESFAATNEREGSEIAGQIVSALLESGVKIFFVTHLVEFARRLYDRQLPNAMFLRAERLPDGARTYKLAPGEPLQTSFGEDVYRMIFG